MRKLLILCLLLGVSGVGLCAENSYKISNIYDGMILKCTGAKQSGKLKEYGSNVIDYYTVKNGNIYSKNMVNMFKYGNGDERKVGKLKIDANEISFKEKLMTGGATNYKWVIIDRQTGEYMFKAKKAHHWSWYTPKAYVEGQCSIVDKIEY